MSRNKSLLLSLAAVALTVIGIWLPEVRHFWVSTPDLDDNVLTRSRVEPDDARLARLSKVPFDFAILDPAAPSVRADAELVLQGKWNSPEFGIMEFTWPFSARDLTKGWESQRLHFAALDHVDQLLVAYESLGDERYLAGARDIVNGWARYERRAIFGRGYIWNDHAMAQRLLVMARYWGYIRHSELADQESVRLLLEFVDRTGRIIARPDQFTARTNHGLMQSLALLHIAASFPELPDSAKFRDVAVDRLHLQLAYYQSPEGVVLEHSPGYHGLGIRIFKGLLSYAPEIGQDFAREATERLAEACQFMDAIQRPDDSLPLIGNTRAGPLPTPCARTTAAGVPGADVRLFPVSGFAAVRYLHLESGESATDSHTTITWSNFATGAHKHDDEMAIVTWSRGLPLLTGVGYWTYGERHERAAYSWRGANGPYLDSEAPAQERESDLLYQGSAGDLAFLHMERVNLRPAGHLSRQLLTFGPDIWLTIDASGATEGSLHAVWTLYPGWAVGAGANSGSFLAIPADESPAVAISFASTGQALTLVPLHASEQPFGGWVTLANAEKFIREAWSIEVDGPAASPIATLWSREPSLGNGGVHWVHWNGEDDWRICLDGSPCRWQAAREGDKLLVHRPDSDIEVNLTRMAPQSASRKQINDRYEEAIHRFPYWRDLVEWRMWATMLVLVGYTLVGLVLVALSHWLPADRHVAGRYVQWLHVAAPILWALLGIGIVFMYF